MYTNLILSILEALSIYVILLDLIPSVLFGILITLILERDWLTYQVLDYDNAYVIDPKLPENERCVNIVC